MPNVIESTGTIESICDVSSLKVGDTTKINFRLLDDSEPPFNCKVTAPGGKVIVERVLRDLPTGKPQSAPPIQFVVAAPGDYRIVISQLYGKGRGEARLHVAEPPPE